MLVWNKNVDGGFFAGVGHSSLMGTEKISAIILAAGRSTRMKSALPKVLHPVCGAPLVGYTVSAVRLAGAAAVSLVVSNDFLDVFKAKFGGAEGVSFDVQKEQRGTADAVKSAVSVLGSDCDWVLIVPGDVPLLRQETLSAFIDATRAGSSQLGLLTMEMNSPASYGRIIRSASNDVVAIKEAKDASAEELLIKEVNSGIYFVKRAWLRDALDQIESNNAQKEFYLTDIVKIATGEGLKVFGFVAKEAVEFMGVNTRKELAEANREMRRRVNDRLMQSGVGFIDDSCTYIDDGALIGPDTVIGPNCVIDSKCVIGSGCVIENGVVIKGSKIGDNVVIKAYSVIEESIVAAKAQVGPFARLRPGAELEEDVKVGNFVEVKKSVLKRGAKANHLSYIGDAVVGERTNVGCGMITCNYDGSKKHRTVIGSDVFIGSDVQFVAPVEVGNKATIAAGSTITENVPENSLAIARSRQVVKANYTKK